MAVSSSYFDCYHQQGGVKEYVMSDVRRMMTHEYIKVNDWLGLIFLLHTNSYFRTLFYYRIGPVKALLIRWYRPGNKYFTISYRTKIGKGMLVAHPYATIINAESIGDNFSCIQCTTLGASKGARPVIGNNVSCGANVIIIGPVHVGNNVTIGAGSVVVKDILDNSVAVGNPARVIKTLPPMGIYSPTVESKRKTVGDFGMDEEIVKQKISIYV